MAVFKEKAAATVAGTAAADGTAAAAKAKPSSVYLVYPVLPLLDHGALIWLPESSAISKRDTTGIQGAMLRQRIQAVPPSYDTCLVKLNSQATAHMSSKDSRSDSIPSPAPLKRSANSAPLSLSASTLLSDMDGLAKCCVTKTHLEMASFMNHADFSDSNRDPLAHVRLRFRRITESVHGDMSYTAYELTLSEWLDVGDIAAHFSWWKAMNEQLWRTDIDVFAETTRRLHHQGVHEDYSFWVSDYPTSPPPDFRPIVIFGSTLQIHYGVVCRLKDPDNGYLHAYLQHNSRLFSSQPREKDVLVLTALRETAESGDVDANWTYAFEAAVNSHDKFNELWPDRIKANDMGMLKTVLKTFRQQPKMALAQSKAIAEIRDGFPSSGLPQYKVDLRLDKAFALSAELQIPTSTEQESNTNFELALAAFFAKLSVYDLDEKA